MNAIRNTFAKWAPLSNNAPADAGKDS